MQLLLKESERNRIGRNNGFAVLDEVTELTVAFFTQRGVERNWFTTILLNLDDLFWGHIEFFCQLFRGWFAAQVLQHLSLNASKFVNDFDHVHWNTNGACLICHSASDGLTNPPGCIRGELVSLGVVELLHCTDQTQVSFLDQIQEEHAATGVTLCKRNDETKVCSEQVVLGVATILCDPLKFALELGSELLP